MHQCTSTPQSHSTPPSPEVKSSSPHTEISLLISSYTLCYSGKRHVLRPVFSFLPSVSCLIFLHSSLYSLLNACFTSSFILQRIQFKMQCFHPYKYMRMRCFHGKTRDCDKYSHSYSQFPITYEYIYEYVTKRQLFCYTEAKTGQRKQG